MGLGTKQELEMMGTEFCSSSVCTPSDSLRVAHRKAHNEKGFSIRKLINAGVPDKVRRATACGTQVFGSITVFSNIGYGVKHCGRLVYYQQWGNITTGHYDPVWISALDDIIEKVEKQQRQVSSANRKLATHTKSLKRNYSAA